ncbi:MAG: hypothetical protein ABIJ23_03145 [Candidatus Magasanikbacteria bacterium]
MNTYNFNDSIKTLLERFPEFKDYTEFKSMGEIHKIPAIVVYGNFSSYVIKKLKVNGENDPTTSKFIDLINELFTDQSVSPHLLKTICLAFFERIPVNNMMYFKKKLIGRALQELEKVNGFTLQYAKMIDVLLEKFPEFKDSEKFKILDDIDNLPYMVYGGFLDYIMEKLQSSGENDQTVKKFIVFINESFANLNADPSALELLQVALFEPLPISKENMIFARKNFTGKALEAFEQTSKYYGIESSKHQPAP